MPNLQGTFAPTPQQKDQQNEHVKHGEPKVKASNPPTLDYQGALAQAT